MGGPRFDDAPPPYAELDPNNCASSSQAHQQSSLGRPSLGILNGRYNVQSRGLEDDFGEDYMPDFGFIAVLDGSVLWLKFDFGAVSGIMMLNRPRSVSEPRFHTVWRGTAPNAYCERAFVDQGADNSNWVEFVGDGHVRGSIRWGASRAYEFEAQRLPGQPMYAEISPWEMRRLYEEYDRSETGDSLENDDRAEDDDSSEEDYYY